MKGIGKLIFYIAIFISGAAVLILEILGTRIISPFYGSTIFVWTSLIVVTLGALAVGYWLGGMLADKYSSPQLFFTTYVLSGVFTILPAKTDQFVLVATDPLGMKYGPLVAATLLFFVPLMFFGMLSPMLIRLITKDEKKSGSSSGSVFALSTAGSIVGGIMAGFVLIPVFSVSQIIVGISTLLVVIGAFGLGLFNGFKRSSRKNIVFFGVFFGLILFPKIEKGHKSLVTIIDHKQSYLGDIKVVDLAAGQYFKCLYVDGSCQTCLNEVGETDGFYQRFLKSTIPQYNLTKDSKVLLLGLGGGGILSILPKEVQVDVIEIDQEVVEATREHFFLKYYPNVTITVDDARHYLATAQGGQYDLILENIALGNSIPSYILSREAFVDMKRLLKNNGVVLAHIGSFDIDGDDIFNESVCATSESVFDYTLILSSRPNELAHMLLYLSNKPILVEFNNDTYVSKKKCSPSLMVTDNKNPLEYYYLSNAVLQRESTIGMGGELFYVQ